MLKLRGVNFKKHAEDDDRVHIGVIAQEVEEVLPEVVSTQTDSNGESFKGVAYDKMVGLLIEAIKDQQKQIDALKEALNKK